MVSDGDSLDRNSVVDEAVAVLEDDDADDLTLTLLAERLSVTQPALYRHLANIGDLWAQVALRARTELLNQLRDAAVGRATDDAIDALAATWRAFATNHAALYKATDVLPLEGDDANEQAVHELVAMLTQVAAGYGLDEVDAEQAAWAMRSAFHGFVVLEAEHGNPDSLDLDATFARLVTLVKGGLHAWIRSEPAASSSSQG